MDTGETWESMMHFPYYPGGRCHPNYIVLGHTKQAWDAGSSVGIPESGRERSRSLGPHRMRPSADLAWWALHGLVPWRKWHLWEDWRHVDSF